jgi:hypothetical protein
METLKSSGVSLAAPASRQVLENLLSSQWQDLRCLQVPLGNHSFSFGLLAHHFREPQPFRARST